MEGAMLRLWFIGAGDGMFTQRSPRCLTNP